LRRASARGANEFHPHLRGLTSPLLGRTPVPHQITGRKRPLLLSGSQPLEIILSHSSPPRPAGRREKDKKSNGENHRKEAGHGLIDGDPWGRNQRRRLRPPAHNGEITYMGIHIKPRKSLYRRFCLLEKAFLI
jgi:hypothetical protein